MKTACRVFTGLVLLVLTSHSVLAQHETKTEPANKLVEFHMALLKRGPRAGEAKTPAMKRVHEQHVNFVLASIDAGRAVIAGPFTDGGDIDGVYVFRASNAAEAKSWAEADPAVVAGLHTVEMHPWWSEDIFRQPTKPMKLTLTFFAFLTRGEKWTPQRTPATEALQKGHMANINRLAEAKKLVAAGPFGDNGRLRGVFVLRVANLEEAKALTATDPAIQAGRFAMEIHPWMVPEGILP